MCFHYRFLQCTIPIKVAILLVSCNFLSVQLLSNSGSILGASKTGKINPFLILIKNPDIQPIFRMYIENILATSELNILKRLKALETRLEINDYPIPISTLPRADIKSPIVSQLRIPSKATHFLKLFLGCQDANL